MQDLSPTIPYLQAAERARPPRPPGSAADQPAGMQPAKSKVVQPIDDFAVGPMSPQPADEINPRHRADVQQRSAPAIIGAGGWGRAFWCARS